MKKRAGAAALLRFAAPSLLGIAVFLVPFTLHGGPNTLLGHLKETLLALFAGREPELAAAVSTAAAVLALAAKFFRPAWIVRDEILHENLTGGPVWFAARVLAMPVALCVWLGAGQAAELGGFVAAFVKEASFIVCGMTPRLVALAVVLGLLSPLVMDFGLVQFIAVYASPVMRPLFRVPGRSAVDCVASWLGSSSMAVVFTAKMYDSGYYTGREAAAVVCGFSLAGIYNIYAVAELMNVGYALPQILLISYSSMILLAALLPRLAPLSSIPDEYISGRSRYAARAEGRRRGMPVLRWALFRGTAQARRMNAAKYLRESRYIIFSLIFSTVPLMITFGTLLLLAADLTLAAKLIAAPFSALFFLLGSPEWEIVAESAVFAFVDQYLAAAAGHALLTEAGRVSCVCLSVVGLINLTEVGLHVWHSSIPLKLWQMAAVYVMRIALSALVVIPAARFLFPA